MVDDITKKNAKNNIKLYKKYKMFAYDWLFYYAISVLFLTTIKHFSMAQILYINGFYALFTIIFQILCNNLINKLNLKASIILGNIFNIIYCSMYIFTNSYVFIIIGNMFGAFGFTLKNISESSILYASLKKIDKISDFSKIEGKSNSKYYYYEAFASFISGFLFILNVYIPLILCLINLIIAFVMSFKFKNVDSKVSQNKYGICKVFTDTKNILTSNRLKVIYIFSFAFAGILGVTSTLYKAILTDVGIQDQYVTMIVCVASIFIGIGAKSLFLIEKKFKNKTLSILSYLLLTSLLIIGITSINNNLNIYSNIILIICISIIGLVQGAYRVAVKKYILSFTTHKIRNRITSLYYIFENIGSTMFSFSIGILLDYFNTSTVCIILAIISIVIIFSILKYMSTRLGLRPEEYSPKDINNVDINK